MFKPPKDDHRYCSESCSREASKRFNPTKEQLQKLVMGMPTVNVAALFGVSDVAVAKRCKKLGVEKRPRGYWAKHYAGKI